jgi:polar amino acid transport system substrate-binding protein
MQIPALGLLALAASMVPAAAAAAAAEAAPQLYMNNLAPFVVDHSSRQPSGLVYELLDQMIQRTASGYQITPLPFKRMAAQMSGLPNTLGVMWRLPENNTSYQWIVKLLDYELVLAVRSGSQFDISSPQAARRLRIGVVLGSPAEAIARRNGFQHIEVAATVESNARKLALGRIDAWIAVPQVIEAGQRAIGGSLADLRLSQQIDHISMYLSCSLQCDSVDFERWRAAVTSMKKDGSYSRIVARYR